MKRKSFALLSALFLLAGVSAWGQISPAPSLLNFQGRLSKPDGTPVPNGNYSVRFSLWTAASGGTEKWNQTINPVTVRNGTFAVLLNTSSGAADKFNNHLFLEIKIGSDAPLTPRQQLVSVAYAMKANSVADGAITGASIANGTITADKLASGATGWLLGGNNITNPATQFLGTTSNQPLVFRANNTEKMRLLPDGKLGIGVTNPTSMVTINSNLAGGISLGPTPGIVIGNPTGSATLLMGQDDGKGVYYGWLQDSYAYIFTINGQPLVLQQYPGSVGIGTNTPDAKAHIAGGPLWTSNGWSKSLALNNAAALELGHGFGQRFGLGASSGHLYLFTTPSEGAADPASYRFVMNGTNGNLGLNTTATTYPVTLNTPAGGYGFVQTAGAINVGTWAGLGAGWFGTQSNHPLYFFVNNGGAAMSISPTGTYPIVLNQNTEVNGLLYAHRAGDAILGSSSTGYGVWGSSTSNAGLRGLSSSGDGVYASTNGGGANAGVFGTSSGANGNGVIGEANNGSSAYGVWGKSAAGWGVRSNGQAGGTTGWSNLSDARYKTNVAPLSHALDSILNLRGVTFEWNREEYADMYFSKGRQIGFIAQEVEKILPELVITDGTGYKSVTYSNLVPVLVEAVKTLKQQNDRKDAELAELKAQMAALAEAVRELQTKANGQK